MHITQPTEFNDLLEQDERLVWTGRPKTGLILRWTDLFLIPFSIIWCGGAIFWVIMASKASIGFAIFGIPFVLLGLMLVFGRFLVDIKQRENTIYGITEDRIIIRSGIFSKKTNSINLKMLTNLEFTEKSDGSGTIFLGPKNPKDQFSMVSGMNWWPGSKSIPALEYIENVREVYSVISKQLR